MGRESLQVGGAVAEIIGGLFSRAARKLAQSLKADVDLIFKRFNAGVLNIGETIAQLEAKRAEAITRLAGKKSGARELEKILPDIEDSIASLKRQALDVQTAFEDQLSLLRLQSDELATFEGKWRSINQTVKGYLATFQAGTAEFDKANEKAKEFLSLSLGAAETGCFRRFGRG